MRSDIFNFSVIMCNQAIKGAGVRPTGKASFRLARPVRQAVLTGGSAV